MNETRHDNTTDATDTTAGVPEPRDTTDTTDTTERDSATDAGAWLTVAEAARVLSISPGAVRKRIERGQLEARKVSGQWVIAVPNTTAAAPSARHDTTRQDATGDTTRHDRATGTTAAPIVPAVAYAQLEAIRDQWLAPLVERIGELEREAGRLTAERDELERERDELRQRLEDRALEPSSDSPASDLWSLGQLRREYKQYSAKVDQEIMELREALERAETAAEVATSADTNTAHETPQRGPQRPWWRFWKRE